MFIGGLHSRFANFFNFHPYIISYVKAVIVSLFFALLAVQNVYAQKQLVVLKNEHVLLRLYPGNEFIYRLKNSKTVHTTYVNNLSDTSVVTHRDTIPFYKIDRVYFRQTKLYNLIGGAMVIGGAAFFLIDQLNYTVIQGHDPSLDGGVSTVSISAVAVGLPLMLIKKKSQKISYRCKLMMVKEGSIFYLPDPHGYQSPYIKN
jgi:hypothetical protein